MYEKAKRSYESYEDIHSKKFIHVGSEGVYQDSVSVLKNLRKEMEAEAEKEGISIPVVLWPKR